MNGSQTAVYGSQTEKSGSQTLTYGSETAIHGSQTASYQGGLILAFLTAQSCTMDCLLILVHKVSQGQIFEGQGQRSIFRATRRILFLFV